LGNESKDDAEEKSHRQGDLYSRPEGPGMLMEKSSIAAIPAKIKNIDTSKAEKLEGQGEGCFNGLQHSSHQIWCL